MVKASVDIIYPTKEGKPTLMYKAGEQLSAEHAWEFQLFAKHLLATYELVNGTWKLKEGAEKVIKPTQKGEKSVETRKTQEKKIIKKR